MLGVYLKWKIVPEKDIGLSRDLVGFYLFGCLPYLALRTRGDILLSTSILAQFVSKPTVYLFSQAKRVLLYVKSTKNMELVYRRSCQVSKEPLRVSDPILYIDSDYAADTADRKSRSGYCAILKKICYRLFTRTRQNKNRALGRQVKLNMWL